MVRPPVIPIAVIGAGWVGTQRHLPVLGSDARFKVIGVIDRDRVRAESTARTFGLERSAGCESLAEVPWLNELQAVSIATAPVGHAPLLAEAREAGLHALTEKPFTLDIQDARHASAPGRTVIAVMHNFQFARSASQLWKDLDGGRLGEVKAVDALQWSNHRRRLPEWYEQLPMGLFFDESPHLLYLLRRLAPAMRLEMAHVSPSRSSQATPSSVMARYTSGHPGDFTITMSVSFVSAVSEWFIAVHGTEGIGLIDLFRDIYVRVPNDGRHRTLDVLRTSFEATSHHWWGFATSGYLHARKRLFYGVDEVVRRFGDAIAAGRDPVDCGRVDALAVRELQEEIVGPFMAGESFIIGDASARTITGQR